MAAATNELSSAGVTTSPAAKKWPNYNLTLYNAVGIDAKTFIRNVRFSYTGPKWVSDGCTGVPEAPSGVSFTDACIQHDFGYGNLPQYRSGRTEDVREIVDLRFYYNMLDACNTATSSVRGLCKLYAYVYAAGVYYYGYPRYYNTPARFD